MWGTTFQTDNKTRNMVGEVPIEFDALVERLNSSLTDRLQEDPTPSSRVLLYGFPPQVAGLKSGDLRFPQPDLFELTVITPTPRCAVFTSRSVPSTAR